MDYEDEKNTFIHIYDLKNRPTHYVTTMENQINKK